MGCFPPGLKCFPKVPSAEGSTAAPKGWGKREFPSNNGSCSEQEHREGRNHWLSSPPPPAVSSPLLCCSFTQLLEQYSSKWDAGRRFPGKKNNKKAAGWPRFGCGAEGVATAHPHFCPPALPHLHPKASRRKVTVPCFGKNKEHPIRTSSKR